MATVRQGVKRKRRPKNVCPNPLFVKWLEEWRDEAMENGWKTSYTFNKALHSMKKYPLPINSGQEARVLEYVGDMVASKIDRKITEYLANGGSVEDLHRIHSDEVSLPSTKRSHKTTSNEQSNNLSQTTSIYSSQAAGTHSHAIGTHSHATGTHSQATKTHSQAASSKTTTCTPDGMPKKKRRRSTKEYVPNYRSGPYAIMLALYKAEQRESYKGFLYKNELIEAAQPFSDSSFTVPDPPDSYYTAWSSMSNLLKRELVTKSGHPPRFSLTDTGVTLSIRLHKQTEAAVPMSHKIIYDENTATDHMIDTCSQESLPCKEPPIKPSSSTITIDSSGSDDDDDSIEVLSLPQRLALQTSHMSKNQCSNISTKSVLQTQTNSNVVQFVPKSTYSSTMISSSNPSSFTTVCPPSLSSSQVTSSGGSAEEVPLDLSTPLYSLRPGEFEVILCIDNSESTANRKSKSNFRGLLLEELTKNGVKFSVRNLNVGDFLWIAKETTTAAPGQLRLPQSREIVLEHIVERKRMDDLADSIIDRRFQEQKFRMKLCGVAYPIYLVEEYGDMTHCKISQRALYQAITNTQVLDEFFIKQTKDITGSIGYLTILTRLLQQRYSSKTINAYPVDTLQSLNKQRHIHILPSNNSVCGIPFDKFNDFSIKNKGGLQRQKQQQLASLLHQLTNDLHACFDVNDARKGMSSISVSTVSEMFARQLIQIPGSSAEKAHCIIQLYPTMNSLYNGYKKCSNEKDRENLLATLRCGTNKRKLGTVLSKTIYTLYWKGQ